GRGGRVVGREWAAENLIDQRSNNPRTCSLGRVEYMLSYRVKWRFTSGPMRGAPENVSSSRHITSGQGLRIHVSMSVRGIRIALNQSARPMRTAARPTLAATTAAPRSVCWYRYRTFWMTSRLMQ